MICTVIFVTFLLVCTVIVVFIISGLGFKFWIESVVQLYPGVVGRISVWVEYSMCVIGIIYTRYCMIIRLVSRGAHSLCIYQDAAARLCHMALRNCFVEKKLRRYIKICVLHEWNARILKSLLCAHCIIHTAFIHLSAYCGTHEGVNDFNLKKYRYLKRAY